jgi:hypothetical protein
MHIVVGRLGSILWFRRLLHCCCGGSGEFLIWLMRLGEGSVWCLGFGFAGGVGWM